VCPGAEPLIATFIPLQYYYERSRWSGKHAYPDNIPWDDKKSVLCKLSQNTDAFPEGLFFSVLLMHRADPQFAFNKRCIVSSRVSGVNPNLSLSSGPVTVNLPEGPTCQRAAHFSSSDSSPRWRAASCFFGGFLGIDVGDLVFYTLDFL
jgi:hypothetical protein